MHVTCVIVDEASQCCELDVLIPLRYGSTKLIMVGDPLQLPPTVRSQVRQVGINGAVILMLYIVR